MMFEFWILTRLVLVFSGILSILINEIQLFVRFGIIDYINDEEIRVNLFWVNISLGRNIWTKSC